MIGGLIVDGAGWSPVVGMGSQRWLTRETEREVVVVVNSLVAGQRLNDVLGLIETDPRIRVVFTRAPGVFGAGTERLLRFWGALEIPWQQAVQLQFDLAIAAAYDGIQQIHAPIMILPHGAGYGKRTPADPHAELDRPVYGLDAGRLIRDGRLVPSCVVLSHERQREVLAAQCPPAARVALVAGDPCLDRLLASLPDRAAYRAALGVPDDRKLVLLTSTWGHNSLFGRNIELMTEVIGELPPRRYRVGALIHPAVWSGVGPRQVRAWLAAARAGGLMLFEPEVDWRAPLLAADWVIGDYGSTTAYAAALGIPVLHNGYPAGELDDFSAQAWLATHTPRRTRSQPLAIQLRAAAAVADQAWRATVTGLISSRPGQANRLLRQEMYRLLGLSVPGRHRAPEPIPLPHRPQPEGMRDVG
jgi:hypothetical protein